MGEKEKESYIDVYPAWASSLPTFVISIILLFIIDGFHGFFEIVASVFYIILIAIACFFICKAHPESVWHTPVICNLMAVVAIIVFVFTDLSTLSELLYWISSLVVSAIGAIVGATLGRRKLIKQKN